VDALHHDGGRAGTPLARWHPAGALPPRWRAATPLARCHPAGALPPRWRAATPLARCHPAGALLPRWLGQGPRPRTLMWRTAPCRSPGSMGAGPVAPRSGLSNRRRCAAPSGFTAGALTRTGVGHHRWSPTHVPRDRPTSWDPRVAFGCGKTKRVHPRRERSPQSHPKTISHPKNGARSRFAPKNGKTKTWANPRRRRPTTRVTG
jgi:hypothetical protein